MLKKNISNVTDDNRLSSFAESLSKFSLFVYHIQECLSGFSANIYVMRGPNYVMRERYLLVVFSRPY